MEPLYAPQAMAAPPPKKHCFQNSCQHSEFLLSRFPAVETDGKPAFLCFNNIMRTEIRKDWPLDSTRSIRAFQITEDHVMLWVDLLLSALPCTPVHSGLVICLNRGGHIFHPKKQDSQFYKGVVCVTFRVRHSLGNAVWIRRYQVWGYMSGTVQ